MKRHRLLTILALICMVVQGVWAQTGITDVMLIGGDESTVDNLKTTYEGQGWTVINYDLNGKTLSRSLSESSDYGMVVWVRQGGALTLLYARRSQAQR